MTEASRPAPPDNGQPDSIHQAGSHRDVAKVVRLAMIAVGLCAGIGVMWRQIKMTEFPVDMAIYLEGVRAFLDGREVYSEPMHAADLSLPFIYPPFGALVMTPLARLTYNDAGNVVIMLSAVMILVCLYYVALALIRRDAFLLGDAAVGMGTPVGTDAAVDSTVDDGSRKDRWIDRRNAATVAAVVWPAVMLIEPVTLNAGFAQINVLLMGLVILDLVPRRRYLPQGWLIGVAAAIKLSPLAMLLYFLLRRDVRAIFSAAASAVIVTALASAVRWDTTVEFFRVTLFGLGGGGEVGVNTAYQSNSSIKGMLMRWFPSEEALDAGGTLLTASWGIAAVATIALGAWLMVALLRRGFNVEAWVVNAFIMLLISPISWSHHWVWLTIALPVLAWFGFRSLLLRSAGGADGVGGGVGATVGVWGMRALGGLVLLWTLLVMTNPPKWWYGDAIDVHALTWQQKFMVSDFVWLAIAVMIALAVALRAVPQIKDATK